MSAWFVGAAGLALVAAVVAGALALAVRVPMAGGALDGTGALAWRETARTLSWSDRRAVDRAANHGRPAPMRLAALTVQRAEMGLAVAERRAVARVDNRLLWRAATAAYGFAAVVNLANAVLEPDHGLRWLTAEVTMAGVVVLLLAPRVQARRSRLQRQALELNRAQADR